MKEIKKAYLFASKKFHQSFVMMLAGGLKNTTRIGQADKPGK